MGNTIMTVKNYVISLTTATDRREHIIEEFGKQGVEFEFFDAVTPKILKETANILQIDLDKNINLSENELSILCSQIFLWKKAIDEKMDYIIIFEDDIYLSGDANYFLTNTTWIPKECDFIKIEKTINKVMLTNTKIINNSQLSQLHSYHFGAGGYILSQKGANILYKHFLSLSKIDHIDQYLFRTVLDFNILPIYQLNPVLCIQDCILNPNNQKFTSSLQWREKIVKTKLNFLQKIGRELKRLYYQVRYEIFKTRLEFKQ